MFIPKDTLSEESSLDALWAAWQVIKRWKSLMDSWNAPLWFGEFGANNDPNPDNVQFQVRP